MQKTEALKILSIVRVAYPTYYAKQTVADVDAAANLWAMMFDAEDANQVALAVKAYIATDTRGFPPSIGQIKDRLDKIRQEIAGRDLTAAEAWSLVSQACKRSYYNAQEEFDKLPDTVRAVLGKASVLHDYATMDVDTLNSVVASNFQRSYDARCAYAIEMRKWPQDVKRLIESERFKAIGAWDTQEA